jgi:hypothetical protein
MAEAARPRALLNGQKDFVFAELRDLQLIGW